MASIKNDYRDFTVASGGTSGTFQIEDFPILGLIVPALTSTTLKIQGGYDGTTFYDVYDSTGTQLLNWTASTGDRCIASRDLADLSGYKYGRVVLGTAQAAERSFRLIQRKPKVG